MPLTKPQARLTGHLPVVESVPGSDTGPGFVASGISAARAVRVGFDEFFGFYSGWMDSFSHRYYGWAPGRRRSCTIFGKTKRKGISRSARRAARRLEAHHQRVQFAQ